MQYRKILILSLALVVVFGLAGLVLNSSAKSESMARKIVVFKSGVLNESARDAITKNAGGVIVKNLDLIGAKSVLLSPKAERALARNSGVLRIEDDIIVEALAKPAPSQPAETLPWGVNRIDADLAWGITAGDPIKVAVVDTGIDVKHPDLAGNLKGGFSAVSYTTSYNDDNGHGTHVAGIIGAVDNEIGVIGVGPQIDLYAVKVLDRRGSGYLSDVIEGLGWAVANGMQVVNMSLGTSSYSASLEDAVKNVYAAGVVQVAAAGNANGGAVIYPAKFPEVIAVSATDSLDNVAYFSSVGPEVDLAAPGASIYSTYKGQTYKTLSGTSMASPHVAGVAALVLSLPSKCDSDLNGVCSPLEVQQRLEATTEDLGASGWDALYGWGLVDAWNALTQ